MAAEVGGAEAATLGEQAGIRAPAAAALSWLAKRCAPRGPRPSVCLSPSTALMPPHQAAPRGVIGWMVDFRVTFLPKVSCVQFLKYEAFCQVLCISALLALVPRCLAPTLFTCVPQQLGLSRAGGGHHIYCYSLFVKQQRLALHRGPYIFTD